MAYRKTFRRRNGILGVLLMAGALLLMGYSFFPTRYRTDSFLIPAGPLSVEYSLIIRYPNFGQADAEAEVSADLIPTAPGDRTPNGAVAFETQSVDIRFDPSGRIMAPLPAGHAVSFRWTARGERAGERSFSLFLIPLAVDEQPGDSLPTPFWAQTFSWNTFAGLGNARPPVLVCAVVLFLLGFGLSLTIFLRRRSAE
jgi:hypothetical protein